MGSSRSTTPTWQSGASRQALRPRVRSAISLRARYAMSGTDSAYAATRAADAGAADRRGGGD
eukprot:2225043-Rhodomonas_salina.3